MTLNFAVSIFMRIALYQLVNKVFVCFGALLKVYSDSDKLLLQVKDCSLLSAAVFITFS